MPDMIDKNFLKKFNEVAHAYHLCVDYQETLAGYMDELRQKLVNLEAEILSETKTPIQDMAALLKLDYVGIQPPPKACKGGGSGMCGGSFVQRDSKTWTCQNGHLLPLAMIGGGRAEDSEHHFYHHGLSGEEEKLRGWSPTRCKATIDSAMSTLKCLRVKEHPGPHYSDWGQGRWWFDLSEQCSG